MKGTISIISLFFIAISITSCGFPIPVNTKHLKGLTLSEKNENKLSYTEFYLPADSIVKTDSMKTNYLLKYDGTKIYFKKLNNEISGELAPNIFRADKVSYKMKEIKAIMNKGVYRIKLSAEGKKGDYATQVVAGKVNLYYYYQATSTLPRQVYVLLKEDDNPDNYIVVHNRQSVVNFIADCPLVVDMVRNHTYKFIPDDKQKEVGFYIKALRTYNNDCKGL